MLVFRFDAGCIGRTEQCVDCVKALVSHTCATWDTFRVSIFCVHLGQWMSETTILVLWRKMCLPNLCKYEILDLWPNWSNSQISSRGVLAANLRCLCHGVGHYFIAIVFCVWVRCPWQNGRFSLEFAISRKRSFPTTAHDSSWWCSTMSLVSNISHAINHQARLHLVARCTVSICWGVHRFYW